MKAVVAGASHWHATWHARALRDAGVVITAAFDPDPTRAAALLGDSGKVCESLDELLDGNGDALVLDLLPPDVSPELIARCLRDGYDVMVEKPGAVDAQSLRGAVPLSSRSRTSVPFINRYASFWTELAARRAAPDDWSFAHFRIHAGPPDRYRRDRVDWVLDPRRFGGGALRNLGIHAADAALQLAGGPLHVVDAVVSSRRWHLAVEDLATATLATVDGRRITIEAGYSMPSETTTDKEWRVVGSDWAISESNGTLVVRDATGRTTQPARSSAAQYECYGADLAGLSDHGPQVADLTDLVAALDLIDHIYTAAGVSSSVPGGHRATGDARPG